MDWYHIQGVFPFNFQYSWLWIYNNPDQHKAGTEDYRYLVFLEDEYILYQVAVRFF